MKKIKIKLSDEEYFEWINNYYLPRKRLENMTWKEFVNSDSTQNGNFHIIYRWGNLLD